MLTKQIINYFVLYQGMRESRSSIALDNNDIASRVEKRISIAGKIIELAKE